MQAAWCRTHIVKVSVLPDDDGALAAQLHGYILHCVSCTLHNDLTNLCAAGEGNLCTNWAWGSAWAAISGEEFSELSHGASFC